jgi:hypothetical protein
MSSNKFSLKGSFNKFVTNAKSFGDKTKNKIQSAYDNITDKIMKESNVEEEEDEVFYFPWESNYFEDVVREDLKNSILNLSLVLFFFFFFILI